MPMQIRRSRRENRNKTSIRVRVTRASQTPTRQPVQPFFPSNAACNIEIALCTLRCLVDGLIDPPSLKPDLRSEFACGGGGVGGELILDALGEEARSRDGVSERPSSEGVIGLEDKGMDMKLGMGVDVGVGDWSCALD